MPSWFPSKSDVPGILLSVGIGSVALVLLHVLPSSPFLSDILVAIALGALIVNTPIARILGIAKAGSDAPDRYAAGLQFTNKWLLRLAIILMGFKVQTKFFGTSELYVIAIVIFLAVPSTFFLVHSIAPLFGVRRAMADLLSAGTMICGASAVNAVAPVVGAKKHEQGIAVAAIFLFSVVALIAFRPLAALIGIDWLYAGVWSGLAVNDLSSAVAVGKQMSEAGGTMAAASKSARVLLIAPAVGIFSFLRAQEAAKGARPKIGELLPKFLFGYILFAIARTAGDRLVQGAWWSDAIATDRLLVDILMATVSGAIGLHLEVHKLLSAGWRAVAVSGSASIWLASLSLAMVYFASKQSPMVASIIGIAALAVAFALYRASRSKVAAAEVADQSHVQG